VALADLTIREIGNHNVYKCNIYQTLRMSTESSMVPWIADINERKDIVNSYKLDRPEGISVGSFVDNMELIMDCVTTMKKEM
jgi:hypothetical protein